MFSIDANKLFVMFLSLRAVVLESQELVRR